MKKYYISLVILAGLLASLFSVSLAQNTIPLFTPGTLRALIFSGRNNHDWRTTTPILKDILLQTGKFDVRVVEEPAGVTAATLEAYDVLILDYNGPRWGEETEKAVEEFVRSGKGLVAVHGASWAFNGWAVLGDGHKRMDIIEPAWKEYRNMVGGYWTDEEPKSGHGKLHTFSVKFIDRSHPVARGMSESLNSITGRWCCRMRGFSPLLMTNRISAGLGRKNRYYGLSIMGKAGRFIPLWDMTKPQCASRVLRPPSPAALNGRRRGMLRFRPNSN